MNQSVMFSPHKWSHAILFRLEVGVSWEVMNDVDPLVRY
jgi:hypothetical protein